MNTDPAIIEELFDKIVLRLTQYGSEQRATIQPDRIAALKELQPGYELATDKDRLASENLMEHVGSLPIIATTIYPYLGETEADLGEALIMLAIHDIGETVLGDIPSFHKTDEHEDAEEVAALSVLHEMYHPYFTDIEYQHTPSGQFAKCVDKLAPDFFDYLCPAELVLPRYERLAKIGTIEEIIALKRDNKADYMAWHPVIADLFEYAMQRLKTHVPTS